MGGVTDYLAVDLGASNGRVLAAAWDGDRFALREVHRFDNEPVSVMGHLHWDALRLWAEVKAGIARHVATSSRGVGGVGVDSWGVDFALLDRDGRLLGNPYHYRDARTNGMVEKVYATVPRSEVFVVTTPQPAAQRVAHPAQHPVVNLEPSRESIAKCRAPDTLAGRAPGYGALSRERVSLRPLFQGDCTTHGC